MDPREFHQLAVRLANGRTAAEFRAASGRAYYAAFNVAADHLRSMRFQIKPSAAAHGEIQHCLANSGDTEIAKIGSDLVIVHGERNRADYRLDATDIETDVHARANVSTAHEIIRALDSAFTGPRRAQIQSAIATWRRSNGYP
jgi:hypothetical protein